MLGTPARAACSCSFPADVVEFWRRKGVTEMHKTNKELAVELMGNYLRAVYSQERIKTLDASGIKSILQACYDAVKDLPDE